MATSERSVSEGSAGDFVLRAVTGMHDFRPEEWNLLSGTSSTSAISLYNPFISYDFLRVFEESGCATARTGWAPRHLRLEAPDGTLVGAVPCYAKSHSQGEYVFDH